MRKPERKELVIISYLFEQANIKLDENSLLVESMHDGNMGSLKLFPNGDIPEYKFGSHVAECWFIDSDGILASGALYLNINDVPFELDMWKVNHSPLKKWANKEEISTSST